MNDLNKLQEIVLGVCIGLPFFSVSILCSYSIAETMREWAFPLLVLALIMPIIAYTVRRLDGASE